MAKVKVHIELELAQPVITGTDYDDVKTWIKTNVTDKLPPNATEVHYIQIFP